MTRREIRNARYTAEAATNTPSYGFICKQGCGPSPMGVGYSSDAPGAAAASAPLTECACGYSVRL